MLMKNSELRAVARTSLSGKWLMAAIASLIYTAVCGGLASIPFIGILAYLATLPLVYGYAAVLLSSYRGEELNIGDLFNGFNDFGRILGTKALELIYIGLWTCLLIVPGIVKMYSYSMTSFILKDEPTLANNAVIEKSMAMMNGHKMKLFLLDLSFIGWVILSLFTLGIGTLFVQAYALSARAAFYDDLKAQQTA